LSSPELSAAGLAPAQRERAFWPSVLALGVGGFAIGTGEFVIMGLLPEVARDLAVSIPQAGHVISAYALGVVIGAPVLAVLAAGWPRRALLLALMALFAAGNLASALAPGYLSLHLLRFIAGLPHGTYFGVAALVAASLAPPHRRASAVGLVMSGLTSATLVGVPIAAWLGQHLGWRAAFVLVGSIAALACVLIRRGVPDLPPPRGASPLRELGALARPQVWLTLGIGAIGFGGMFAVFSYIKPTLIETTGLSLEAMPLMLALFGIGMVVGNLAGSRLADRSLKGTIAALLLWNVLVQRGRLAERPALAHPQQEKQQPHAASSEASAPA
jgi:DHA1 family inner membrane transport protein